MLICSSFKIPIKYNFHYRHGHGHGDHRRSGGDLRDRLNNRNQGPRRRPKDHHRNRDRQGGRPQHSRPQETRPHKERSENPEKDKERDMRLQRLINANSAKAESKRDIEMKREKAAREKRWVQNTFL